MATEFVRGTAYPSDRARDSSVDFGSFITLHRHVIDMTPIVLIRDGKYYHLNNWRNREIAEGKCVKGDVFLFDHSATLFLTWRSQNPMADLSVFWKANPTIANDALEYSPAPPKIETPRSRDSQTAPTISENEADRPADVSAIEPPQTTTDVGPQADTLLLSNDATHSSPPWNGIAVASIAAIGLLWLLLKRKVK